MHIQERSVHKHLTLSALPSSTVLCRVREAFLHGLALSPASKGTQPAQPWSKELEESPTLPLEQQPLVKRCIFYLAKARDLAAQGDITASIQLFAVARTYRDDGRLGDEARQLCASNLEAAEAYLDYISGDFNAARQRILAAMVADQTLEEIYGYVHLHVHRIHLANNLVKLEACAGTLDAALALAAELLSYLSGQVESINAPTRWGTAWTSALSEQARQYLAIQTTREIGCAIAGYCDARTLACWQHSIAPLMRAPVPALRGSRLLEWYELKQSYLACSRHSGFEGYLESAAAYLEKGPRENLLCWQLVALDALLACSACESAEALELCQEVAKSLSQARSLPRHLRVLLQRARPAAPAIQPSTYERHTRGSRKTGSGGD